MTKMMPFSFLGKTCLLLTYSENRFPDELINTKYLPTVLENYVARVMVNNVSMQLDLWDTSENEYYDRNRPMSYPETVCV